MNCIKTHKKYCVIFIFLILFFLAMILFDKSKFSNKKAENKILINGNFDFNEYLGNNICLNYEINADSDKNIFSIDLQISYNSLTILTTCIYVDNNGIASIKIPLFSSNVYTFNFKPYIPLIINYLINKKPDFHLINKILFSITSIEFGNCNVSVPTGTNKKLTSSDINMLYNNFRRSFLE